ncbi:MAG: YjdF family protein [Clostridia bacterium]
MDRVHVTFTVFFEDPFWVGVLESVANGKQKVSKITFGAEPKDYEIHRFLLENYHRLRFSPAVAVKEETPVRNPKRLQRELRKQTQNTGISTKSQQALQMQRETLKTERKQHSKAEREAEKERQFQLRQQKRKEKHRGR